MKTVSSHCHLSFTESDLCSPALCYKKIVKKTATVHNHIAPALLPCPVIFCVSQTIVNEVVHSKLFPPASPPCFTAKEWFLGYKMCVLVYCDHILILQKNFKGFVEYLQGHMSQILLENEYHLTDLLALILWVYIIVSQWGVRWYFYISLSVFCQCKNGSIPRYCKNCVLVLSQSDKPTIMK